MNKLILLLMLVPLVSSGQIIQSTNRTDWTPGLTVGVLGGIPNYTNKIVDVTQSPYNADKTGATDASTAINSAISSEPSNTVIFLPAGTYTFNSAVNFGFGKNYKILRGEGPTKTFLNFNGSLSGLNIGVNVSLGSPTNNNIVTSGATKGSTNVTIGSATPFTVGQMIEIATANNNAPLVFAAPFVSVGGDDLLPFHHPNRKSMHMVMAKTGTTLTFWPPLVDDYSGVTNIVYDAVLDNIGDGVESMFLEMTNSTYTQGGICMNNDYGCWVTNVTIHASANYHITMYQCANCEVRYSKLDTINHGGTSGSGLLFHQATSSCLIVDNQILNNFPCIELNNGANGNVIAYNFIWNDSGTTAILGDHAPHVSFNLWEGNVVNNMEYDSYFGSATQETIYRNWITGQGGGGSTNNWTYGVAFNRWCWAFNFIGNIIGSPNVTQPDNGYRWGYPNIGNGLFTGAAPPWTNAWTNFSTLTCTGGSLVSSVPAFRSAYIYGGAQNYSGIDNLSVIVVAGTPYKLDSVSSSTVAHSPDMPNVTNVDFILSENQSGFQAIDANVQATMLLKGNYNFFDNAIPAGESIGATNLDNSLVYGAKPSWFGNCPWPPFDSKSVGSLSKTNIPAGARFFGVGSATGVVYGVQLIK